MASRFLAVAAVLLLAQSAMALDLGIQAGMNLGGSTDEQALVDPRVMFTASPGFIGKTGLIPELGLSTWLDNSSRPRTDGYWLDEHPDYEKNDKIGLHGALRLTYSGEQRARRIPLRMWAAIGAGIGYGSESVGGDWIENTWAFIPSTVEYIRLHYSTTETQSIAAEFTVMQQHNDALFAGPRYHHKLALSFGYQFQI